MSDVATLRTAVEALPRYNKTVNVHGSVGMDKDADGHWLWRDAVLDLIPPDAILIDPTAPETVAALAAALDATEARTRNVDAAADRMWAKHQRKRAAAILLAFVARLRGET